MTTREEKQMDSREQLFYVCYIFAKNTQQMRFTVQEVISYYRKNYSHFADKSPYVKSQIQNCNIYNLLDELFHVNYITKTKYIGVKPLFISFTKEQYEYAGQYFTYLRKLGILQ